MIVLSHHAASSDRNPAAVYSLWASPSSWPSWDPDVVWVTFDAPLEVGASGTLRAASGPPARFAVTGLEADRRLTTASTLPGAKMTFDHLAQPTESGAEITVTVTLDGPLAWAWGRILRKSMTDAARRNIEGLLAYVEART